MSIKSQKSLNDECSEIFEKSYSVRSGSEESLYCDDEETLTDELLKKMTPATLSKLRKQFKRSRKRNADIDRRVEEVMRVAAAEEGIEFPAKEKMKGDDLYLDHEAFADAVRDIFGPKYIVHVEKLIQVLDPFGCGRVGWAQLVSRLVETGMRVTGARVDRWTPVKETRVTQLKHCKRETIVKVVSIERQKSFCYVIVSRGGRVGVYSGSLQILLSYEIFYHKTGLRKRVKNCWITDAVYMSDVQCLAFSASDRSLIVYEVSSLTHSPLFTITGLPHIPTCLAYCEAAASSFSELIFGSERGDVTRLLFLRPRVALLPVHSPDHITTYFWMELSSPPLPSYCRTVTWRPHCRAVRRVTCRPEAVVLTCSHDARSGLRLRRTSLLPDYVYAVPRGITCFDMSTSLQLLATGSPDGIVRLWGTTGGASHARLQASAAVLDVAVVAPSEIVVAFSGDTNIHIWDIFEECLLQVIKIKFPFLGVLGKKVEFGTYCIHPGPPREITDATGHDDTRAPNSIGDHERVRCEILVTCCDCVCVLALRPPTGDVKAAPGDTLQARRPSYWELPEDFNAERRIVVSQEPATIPTTERCQPLDDAPLPPPSLASPPLLPSPPELAPPTQNLDDLLTKAGLQGILERDFVLSSGLKHDLNSKIHELEQNMAAMKTFVSLGTPYLALRNCELDSIPNFEHLMLARDHIVRSYPDSKVVTPAGSVRSTPRLQSTPRHN